MVLLALTLGCDLGGIRNQIDGLINPLVAEGLVIGVAQPLDDRIDLSSLGYDPGANATVFLADASDPTRLDEALVGGATVTARIGASEADLPERDEGVYVTDPLSGLEYTEGQTLTITAELDDRAGTGSLALPQGAGLTSFDAHTTGEALEVDVSGLGYTGSLIVVFDTLSGQLTYTNEPTDAKGIYDLTRGNQELDAVTVPAEAFPNDSVYALGFAGLVNTKASDFDNMNTVLSGILTGQLEFTPVVTAPLP